MNSIGFIGLGNMGSGMVKNLLQAGFDVIGYDIESEKVEELVVTGLKSAKSIDDIAQACEVIILCLPNPDTTYKVIFEGLLITGNAVKTIIETSTLTPEIVLDITKRLIEKDKLFLSAPMIGGKNSANNQTILFLVEGKKETYDLSLSLLQSMGSRADYMGDAPSATLAKLVFNLCRYANLAVAVEAHRLLQPYNPNMQAIYDFMTEQSLDNFGQVWGEDMKDMMTNGVLYTPSQVPKKDLSLLSDMAQKHSINDSLIKTIRKTYESME